MRDTPESGYRDPLAAYRDATALSPVALARIRARLERQASPRGGGWRLGVVALGGLVVGSWWVARPPTEVSEALVASAGAVTITPDVVADVEGEGDVQGDSKHLHVRWESGTLSLEVTPEQGVGLDVTTEEGVVHVVGTGFDVARDALGTLVRVRHGRVQVDCTAGGSVTLGAGEDHTCLPRTASGMLGRARALQDRGAPGSDVLAAVDGGLALAETGPVEDELKFLRLTGLIAAARPEEARPLAAELLAVPGNPRRLEVTRIALALAVLQTDCASARPLAVELMAGGQHTADVSLDAFQTRCPAEASGL